MALCIALSLVRISFAFEPTEPGKGENGDDRGVFPEQKQNNLISNPGFENKTSRWVLGKINGGAGQFTTDTISSISGERSARVTTRNHNKEYKDLSLFTFLPLENGTNYTFSFQASAQTGCLISVSFDNGDQSYFTEEIWLEPRLKTYGPFSFTAIDDDIFNRLCFNLGKSNTVIQLDDVRVNATHIEEELPEKLSASGVNLEYLQDSEYNSILVSVPVKPAQDIPILS